MLINKSCNFFLRNVYSYDIAACHHTILSNLGFDVSKLDKEDKDKRNIQIGQMMKENPRITTMLRETTNSLISEYLNVNNIKEDVDIITRQYDGVLSLKKFEILDRYIPLLLKEIYTIMIISSDRQKYIAVNESGEVIVKGVSNKYEAMDNVYKKILNINFISKTDVFKSLEKIKENIIKGIDIEIYLIPDGEYYSVYFKEFGRIRLSKVSIDTDILSIDGNDIDTNVYYDVYLKTFIRSIVYDFIWEGVKHGNI